MTLERKTDRAFRTLEGIVSGILVDSVIDAGEIRQLEIWCDEYRDLCAEHPFCQIVPYIHRILEDGKISADEMETLQWFISQLYQDSVQPGAKPSSGAESGTVAGKAASAAAAEAAADRLNGLLYGIMADGSVNAAELATLRECMRNNKGSTACERYNERFGALFKAVEAVPQDREPTKEEQVLLEGIIRKLIGGR